MWRAACLGCRRRIEKRLQCDFLHEHIACHSCCLMWAVCYDRPRASRMRSASQRLWPSYAERPRACSFLQCPRRPQALQLAQATRCAYFFSCPLEQTSLLNLITAASATLGSLRICARQQCCQVLRCLYGSSVQSASSSHVHWTLAHRGPVRERAAGTNAPRTSQSLWHLTALTAAAHLCTGTWSRVSPPGAIGTGDVI